jgi:NAD-dependent deacetylase
MFGQPLPENAFHMSQEMVSKSDLMMVIGTTLLVQPANSLPGVALRLGIPLVIINLDDTQYDKYATAVIHEPAGIFLNQVNECLRHMDT